MWNFYLVSVTFTVIKIIVYAFQALLYVMTYYLKTLRDVMLPDARRKAGEGVRFLICEWEPPKAGYSWKFVNLTKIHTNIKHITIWN